MTRREMITGIFSAAVTTSAVRTEGDETRKPTGNPIFRISEVEVFPEYLEEYLVFGKEVAVASVTNEPGVISIFPMQDLKKPTQIRIVEIYADEGAYKSHIASAHFQKYKKGTLHMVKDLKLLDHQALASELTGSVFKKA